MYSLDINFLKDRGLENKSEAQTVVLQKKSASVNDKIPIIAGAIVAVLLPALTFGYMKKIEAKTAKIEGETQQMEAEIARLGDLNKKIEEANAQLEVANKEAQALVTVFDRIKPWSAILQEVSDRTPPGVLVDSLAQSQSDKGIQLQIAGEARHYNDVNDFVLFLKRSPFFSEKNVVMGTVSSSDLSIDLEEKPILPENTELEIPKGVKYTITAQLSDAPASELIREIDSKGAIGVVTRLKTLESKGAITK
jgi:type IV pilus assembly protein PilN